jgi:hypothetical protein
MLQLHPHNFLVALDHLISHLEKQFKIQGGALSGEHGCVEVLVLAGYELFRGIVGGGPGRFYPLDGRLKHVLKVGGLVCLRAGADGRNRIDRRDIRNSIDQCG